MNRIIKENFRKEFKGDWVILNGANVKQLDYYSFPVLVEKKPNIFECRCLFLLENFYFLSCVGTEKVFVHNKPHCIYGSYLWMCSTYGSIKGFCYDKF